MAPFFKRQTCEQRCRLRCRLTPVKRAFRHICAVLTNRRDDLIENPSLKLFCRREFTSHYQTVNIPLRNDRHILHTSRSKDGTFPPTLLFAGRLFLRLGLQEIAAPRRKRVQPSFSDPREARSEQVTPFFLAHRETKRIPSSGRYRSALFERSSFSSYLQPCRSETSLESRIYVRYDKRDKEV